MNVGDKKSIKTFSKILLGIGLIGGISACTTTSTVKVDKAAPITYKIGEGDSSYAALTQPQPSPAPSTSIPYTAPSTSPLAVPRKHAVKPKAPQSADLSNIDRGLYDHMKIGKPYKVAGQSYTPKHNPDYDKIGVASWYGDKFHGKPTANGEAYDKNALTAAHKTLPLNSYVYVTNLETGKSLKVRLNDRGPFIDGRIIDLSEAAAGALGIRGEGLGRVRVQYAGAAPTTDAGKPFKPAKPAQIAERAAPSKHPEAQTPKSFEPKSPLSAPVQPVYRPLRDGGTSPSYVAQQNQEIFQVPNISGEVDQSPSIALPQSRSADAYDMPPIPQPIDENVEEGVVTLTIKGPVHMANIKTKKEKVELIPASYNGEK